MMQTPPLPGKELQRLQQLWRYTLHDRRHDATLDEMTRRASQMMEAPMATLSLIDADCQWFKSAHGMLVDEMPREISFCAHTILDDALLEVPDTHLDPRFANYPQVIEAPFVRYYLGAPLLTRDGHALGSLCVLDTRPRQASQHQRQLLTLLARQVIQYFEQRLDARSMAAVDDANIGVWELDVESGAAFWSPAIYRQLGIAEDQPSLPDTAISRYHPDDQLRIRQALHDAIAQQRGFEMVLRVSNPGAEDDWIQLTGEPLVVEGKTVQVHGTARNVNRLKRIEQRLQQ